MSDPQDDTVRLNGILAEYGDVTALVKASRVVRDAGYSRWDTYTPFPVHGIEKAMGIRMTRLPWIVLVCALTGLGLAIWMQWWMNAVDYPYISSGKPMWSIPANVPVYFELSVLFSAFASLISMLLLNNLPQPSHPLDLKERFAKATDDRFFLYIEAADPKFDDRDTRAMLQKTAAADVQDVMDDVTTSAEMPRGIIYLGIVAAVAALVPFAFIAKARATKTSTPRIHVVGDMDWQAKFQAQQPNPFFADGRAMRAPEPGTVALGELDDDEHLHKGKQGGAYARLFPAQIELSEKTMERGRERFEIFCAPCHGLSGNGDGMVAQRAASLAEGTWIPPTAIGQEYLRQQPVGQLYESIANGVRNMPAYGPQLTVEDRWAIVMYVRALQKSKGASPADLTDAERAALK